MSANNQHGMAEKNHYARYDALPEPIKRHLRYADVDLCVWPFERLLASWSVTKALELARYTHWTSRRVRILEHYGPNHPQVNR